MSKNKFIAHENVFDESTLRALHKLSSQRYFDDIASPISIGKESNVFTVTHKDGFRVVKIYRTAANFKQMYDYMKPDPRYSNVKGSKLTVIYSWAKKEYANLHKSRDKKVTVPTPYVVYKNVLVMEHIEGKQMRQDVPKDPIVFYEKLIKEVISLLKAGLVHTDISEYNVLNKDEEPVLIDFSHAVDLRYPNVERLLKRDVKNMVRFFTKLGVENLNEEKEFQRIWMQKPSKFQ
jgi:RIO kinase 1